MDAYTPMPIEGLAEAVGFPPQLGVAHCSVLAACAARAGGFGLLWWITVIAYPHNVAGRPFNSWPAYIPITFECTVLLAALSAVIGMLALNKLPSRIIRCSTSRIFPARSIDRFFLCIEATDPKFDMAKTKAFLEELNPEEVAEVEK